MQLCKNRFANGEIRVGAVIEGSVRWLDLGNSFRALSDILHADQPLAVVKKLLSTSAHGTPWGELNLLPPLDRQEVWAAGVTYKRSQEARERESAGAARFYDLVYSAPRPELFFKAPAERVVGSGEPVHIRRDSRWSVPEPELALVLSPKLKLVGYTIGNDMSSRDIEGENPLYLPQAKLYDRSCALGPVITLSDSMPSLESAQISMSIERQGARVFEGSTPLTAMKRSFDELAQWLGRETSFPHGVVLLTGTGLVPPDDFTLAVGDVVTIDITGIGRLTNLVQHRPASSER
jgi:2-dehydro-3-deoxy-D-arabinonate dehydratase